MSDTLPHPVQHIKQNGRRLMDRDKHDPGRGRSVPHAVCISVATRGNLGQQLEEVVGVVRIQPARRLIEYKDPGIGHKLHPDGHSAKGVI